MNLRSALAPSSCKELQHIVRDPRSLALALAAAAADAAAVRLRAEPGCGPHPHDDLRPGPDARRAAT